jgi:predicted AlkP superfamily phosphohydrolase/phosphomutase
MKVLIIGLDGATWDVLDDFLLSNHMPNLNGLKTNGYSGVLQSTHPPSTPPAWTTCITGCQPYTHGVVGFRDYSFRNNSLRISTAASCRVPTMWEELSNQGYKVASINVPWTYPCRKVNGIMVAGYGLPGTEVQFTYPEDFRKELLEKIPDYQILARWEKSENNDQEQFEVNVSRVERSFEQRLETAVLVNEKIKPDVMMVQFQNTDLIQHFVWPYLDKHTRDKYPFERDRFFTMFEKLDRIIGDLLKLADSDNSVVAIVSDHGLCKLLGSVRLNMLLYDWGYLKFQSRVHRFFRRCRRNLDSLLSKEKSTWTIEFKTPVDWKRTKAMMTYPSMNGNIYLNVKGRNENGCVHQGEEDNNIINDLKLRFSKVVNPLTGEQIFSHVATPEELYNCENIDAEIVGDLVLVPARGYIVHQSTKRKGDRIRLQPEDSFPGCHCYEGIYIFCGSNIHSGRSEQAHIVDIAPTIYAALEAKMPDYLDGRVLESIFIEKKEIMHQEKQADLSQQTRDKRVLSAKEEDEITKRLSALGYMD